MILCFTHLVPVSHYQSTPLDALRHTRACLVWVWQALLLVLMSLVVRVFAALGINFFERNSQTMGCSRDRDSNWSHLQATWKLEPEMPHCKRTTPSKDSEKWPGMFGWKNSSVPMHGNKEVEWLRWVTGCGKIVTHGISEKKNSMLYEHVWKTRSRLFGWISKTTVLFRWDTRSLILQKKTTFLLATPGRREWFFSAAVVSCW